MSDLDTSKTFVEKIKAKWESLPENAGKKCTPYRVAKILGMSTTGVYNSIDRDSVFDDEAGYAIAKYLELDRGYVLSCLSVERSKSPEVKSSWERVARLLEAYTGRAAVIVLGVFVVYSMSATDVLASSNISTSVQSLLCQILILFIMRKFKENKPIYNFSL